MAWRQPRTSLSSVGRHFVRKPKAGRGRVRPPAEARLEPERGGRALFTDDVFPLLVCLVVFGWIGLLRGGRGKIVCCLEAPRTGM